jgi:dinuclear metal center YbgI/SA1388 family protein
MTTVHDVTSVVEGLWPERGAEDWDTVGLVVGQRSDPVTHIRLVVDVTPEIITDALEAGADFIIAHHPLLLRGITSVAEETYKGACVTALIRARIGLLAAHTNADIVERGVSDVLATKLGLVEVSPIVPSLGSESAGVGRVGNLGQATTLGVLARAVANLVPVTAQGIRVSGEFAREVRRVAICGGAGDSLLSEATVREADVFITSDLRHHHASEFREWAKLNGGAALIDVSHWASEWVWLDTAAEQLRTALSAVTVSVSDVRTDPWDFLVVQ